MTPGEPDRGSATLWAVGVLAVMFVVMLVGVGLGAATSGRHRAEAAADLAALAAASYAADGEVSACAQAARVVAEMSGSLTSCRVPGWEAQVEVRVPVSVVPGPWGIAVGRARAGPVEEVVPLNHGVVP